MMNDVPMVKAKATVLKISPRKLSLVTDLIRKYSITQAVMQLAFCKKKAAFYVNKVLKSALANAQYNYNLNVDDLYINKILVGKSVTLKRVCPKAMGRANKINKRYSNMTIELKKRV
ncbi:50S ribosomal protein L22 [Candidatus Mesenet endosymbiont of Agriotes lineatus]|uniref:50S ribosomal protein L22 n=1 Tax=Candidatus Mesenet endosymbiont of Agriotes lineatus TaxID=3077948 RepID=UPI003977ABCB